MKIKDIVFIICSIGILIGAVSGIVCEFNLPNLEFILIITGIPFVIAAYYLIVRKDGRLIEEYDEEHKTDDIEYRESEELDAKTISYRETISKIDRSVIRDIFNRTRSSGVDLITGDPRFGIIFIAFVMLIPFVASQVNIFVDTMWVSYLGSGAMAAVGVIKVFYSFVICVAHGIGIGGSNRISFYLGKGDVESASRIATNTFIAGLVASAVITVFLLIFLGPILDLMGVHGHTKDLALQYALPINICTVITILSVSASNLLRSEGAVGKVTLSTFISVIVNMIVDPILIFGLGMGISGAGWATVIAHLVIIIMTVYWYRKGKMQFKFKLFGHFDRKSMSEINSVAIPRSLEEGFSTSLFLIQRVLLLSAGGAAYITIQDAGFTYISLLQSVPAAIGAAVLTVCSAAAGGGNRENFRRGTFTAMKLLVTLFLIASVILFIFADPTMSLFIHGDTEQYRDIIVWTARLYCVILPLYGMARLSSYIMQVLRRSKEAAKINLLSVSVRFAIYFVPVLMGDTSYQAMAGAIAFGYLVEFLIKMSALIFYYAKTDFHKTLTV